MPHRRSNQAPMKSKRLCGCPATDTDSVISSRPA